jgi:replicative DNA helicase
MQLITDTEAEQRVISSVLHSENACIETFSTLRDEDFYTPITKNVFSLASCPFIRGIIPTYVEVFREGNTLGLFSNNEDRSDLHYIAEQYIDDKNIKYWLDRVSNASKGRKAQEFLNKYTAELQLPNTNIPDLIQRAGSNFMVLAMDSDSEKVDDAETVAELGEILVAENVVKWRKMQDDFKFHGQVPLEGVTTGLPRLDSLVLGYKPGDLIILGAQTGHGKTAFALNTAMAACIDSKTPLLYVNTEMSRTQIAYRWGLLCLRYRFKKSGPDH